MKKLFKIFLGIVMFMFVTIQVKGQDSIVDNKSISNLNGVITSLKELNDNNLVNIINTLEKLSTETLGVCQFQELSSREKEEVVFVIDNVNFTLSKINYGSYDSVIVNLEEILKEYSSYGNLKNSIVK